MKETPQQKFARLNPDKIKKAHKKYRNSEKGNNKIYERHLKTNFDLTLEDYNKKLNFQEGTCFVCKKVCNTGNRLVVDHDHSCCPGKVSCGKCVRDLLCFNCNVILGKVSDSKEILLNLVGYLEKWSMK